MKLLSAIHKEILEVSHDRTMLAVLVVFPIFIMLFIGSSFRSMDINGLSVGVVGPQNSSFSAMLLSGLNQSNAFNLLEFPDENSAMAAFRNGQLKAVIVIPQDFETELAMGNGSRITIVVDNSDLSLEQSVMAAMSAVVQASSANITVSYVSQAWKELSDLNASAASLSGEIAASRTNMNQTKARLDGIRESMDQINISGLEASLVQAQASTASLEDMLAAQKEALISATESNQEFLNQTSYVMQNASESLNESIAAVADTHAKLASQTQSLNQSATELGTAIEGLSAIRNGSNDTVLDAALDLDIMSLQSLQNTTVSQMKDAQNETMMLESLNSTLMGFRQSLSDYSGTLSEAMAENNTGAILDAMDNASAQIESLNATFASATGEVAQLQSVMQEAKDAMSDMDTTLDSAINQTASFDSLILSLSNTVAEQTAKDPERIASPLAIDVQNQYVRTSFVDFMMPQVIAVSLLFSCLLLSSISFVREKTGNTIVRALMTPLGLPNLVLGKIISMVLLSLVQVGIILVVAVLGFGVSPPLNYITLLEGITISALVLSSIGILVGFYAKTESAAIQTCLLIAIPMLFLGNIIFSPDLLPNYTQILQELLPLAHITSIFKIVLITNGDPAIDMGALLFYFVLLAAVIAFVMVKRKDISYFT